MAKSNIDIDTAVRHLCARDHVMKSIIQAVGDYTLRPEKDRFWMLVRSIISQQISVGAARSIRKRVEEVVAPDKVTPEAILNLTPEDLRNTGLSRQKVIYIRDLAEKVEGGHVALRSIGRLSDEDVINHLTQVKGIGRWTAEMFLIFSLGRPDVFPMDDLGVKTAIRDRYGLAELPDKETIAKIARPWRPYASVASWYCWRSIDLAKQRPVNADAESI